MDYILRLLILIFSIESNAQLYLHESVSEIGIAGTSTEVAKPSGNRFKKEEPLNIKLCNYSNVNGSTSNTSILMLIPAAAMKSGRLSSCALYESIEDIEGDTIAGIVLKDRKSIDDYVRKDCNEMICRARNAGLISDRAQEVVSLTKKASKSSSTSATRNLNKIAKKYEFACHNLIRKFI